MAVMVSPGAGRVLIAEGAGPLVAEPSWTRYDNIIACRCYGFDSYAGRQSELDTTDTGNATVYFHDQDRTLDDASLVGLQIMLQLYNPVLAEWEIRWRGHIDELQRGLLDTPGAPAADTALICVGIFDYLGGVKMLAGVDQVFGHYGGPNMPPDVVFYEDAPVNDRLTTLRTDAEIDSTMAVIFSGNVDLNETIYDPDDTILQAMRDAADAEWPGIGQVYEDRFGRVVFHGRFARFDPEGTAAEVPGAWDFTHWLGGTREDAPAQVREFSYNIPRTRIINSYLAWPKEDENGKPFDRASISNLRKRNYTSSDAYGLRGREAPDLIIKEHKTNGNTGAEECEIFGDWYINNYSTPKKAVQSISFSSLPPGDSRAADTWDLICRCDVSDVIELTIDEAGIAGEEFIVDGVQIACRVANPGYDHVVITPNLTPGSYYGNPIEGG